MTAQATTVRAMHDVGLAAWFGGKLMGAVGLNGGASTANDPSERLRLSSAGWARWAPVQLGALIVHGIGGIGLNMTNKTRLAGQPETRTNTLIKLAITVAAGAAGLYAGILGARIARHADEGGDGVTEPDDNTSAVLASAQRQQRIVQWVPPVLTAALIVLGAQQGEQQRPIAGLLHSLLHR